MMLSINVGVDTLASPLVQAALAADLTGIILEITEHADVNDDVEVMTAIQDYRSRGAVIAVDDWGKAPSDMGRLMLLRPDIVKIDMSLVHSIDSAYHVGAVRASCAHCVISASTTGRASCSVGRHPPPSWLLRTVDWTRRLSRPGRVACSRLLSMLTRCCVAVLLLSFLAACGDDPDPDADEPASSAASDATESPTATTTAEPTPTPTPSPTPEPEPGTRIVVADSEFGQMLFDSTGQAIYLFDIETTSKPECYDACAEAWPPVLTTGDPVAGQGVDSSLLATTERTDGTVQVTYNDHPLYFYAHEGKNEVLCHDIFLNGGNWYVVQPDGDAAPPG